MYEGEFVNKTEELLELWYMGYLSFDDEQIEAIETWEV